ncbi:MAG: hypothetical protein H8D37_01385 [Chloroflexi bacterium]|nr:hypothetical protein [Chloroflexota bacterium]
MDKKTQGMIATVAAVILCGCPGLVGVCSGAIFAFAGVVPGSEIDVFGSSEPAAAITTGIVTLCISIIFIAIPIVVGFLMLREKPEDVIEGEVIEEPIPGEDL